MDGFAFLDAAEEVGSMRYNTQVGKKGALCAIRAHTATSAASFLQWERACTAGLRTAPMRWCVQNAESRFPQNPVKPPR